MTREEIITAVNNTFTEMLEVPPEELAPEKEIFKDLGLDSLDMVDLMIGLQRKFGVSLRQNEEIRKIVTLGDVYNFFEKMEAQLRGGETPAKQE
ncbi:MAG: phosphopantetheine-binding protein [Victivallales bacterium]|jgi:phosphopantetheine-binding protein